MKKKLLLALALTLALMLTCSALAMADDNIDLKLTMDEGVATVKIGEVVFSSSQDVKVTPSALENEKLYIYVTLQADQELKTATYGGKAVTPTYIADGQKYQIVVSPVQDAELRLATRIEITEVALTVDAPAVGAYPDFSVDVPGGKFYTVKSVAWKQDSTELTSSSTFAADAVYSLIVKLEADKGYVFSKVDSNKFNGKVLVNGTQAGASVLTALVTADGLEITYLWDKLGAPVITTQPADTTAIIGKKATFSVVATGEDLHYQWYKVATPDEKVGTDSAKLTFDEIKADLAGEYYCVVSNEVGAVTSAKAKLTVSDYVFPFTDVKEGDWFYGYVAYANRLGLVAGRTKTEFAPNENMTYAEAIKLAACMHQLKNDGKVTLTKGSPWYKPFAEYARENGIPYDFDDYNEPVTRADYVYIFYYALDKDDYTAINDIETLPDVTENTKHSKEIFAFYNAGILAGNDAKGTFAPNSKIQRKEVVAILTRMMDETTRLELNLAK